MKTFNWGCLTGSEIYFIVIMEGDMQADMVLEKELKVLHHDPQMVERFLVLHCAELEHIKP